MPLTRYQILLANERTLLRLLSAINGHPTIDTIENVPGLSPDKRLYVTHEDHDAGRSTARISIVSGVASLGHVNR